MTEWDPDLRMMVYSRAEIRTIQPVMSTLETEEATIIEVHTEEDRENDRRLVEAYDNPPGDCAACHTGKTRPCHCGGRIHNEMHGRLVEMCFSCGTSWQ